MADKRKVPEIRFKEFSGEWSDSKLEEMVSFSKGRGYSKSDLTDVGTPIILYGRMYTNYQTVISNVNSFTTPKLNSLFSKGNEIIIPSSGESAEDIARASVIGNSNIIIGGDLNVLLPKSDYDPVFLAYNISYGKPKRELEKRAQGKTVVHLHNSDLQELLISYPKKNEQSRIVTVLQNLDSLIILHQRKFDKLATVKKAMLEKMFPKAGANVPEIRFKGFAGKWEKRPLGEITTPFAESVPTPKDGYWRLGIRSHAKGTFHSYVQPGRELETAKMHKVSANNFIVNITFAWEHAVAITDGRDDGKLVSHRFPQFSFNEGMVPEYFKFLILDERFKYHLWQSSPGGAGRNRVLKINEMLEYPFWVPKETEQAKIANFFQNLDSLITLQQRELDKLKNINKACLEKMFV